MKLTVSDLTFSYDDRPLLDRLSFSVRKGEFIGLLGPSGCGKSTVLKLLSGVLRGDAGTVLIDGVPCRETAGRFAYMPQNDLLFPWKNILDNVCLYGRIRGSLREAREEARKHFPAFGLSGYEYRYPSSLSGGMRQRAAFLRTALCQADILLLDEPFGALDVITRGEMQDWLLSMRERLDRTVILVTHDMDEAIYLSDRILILNGSPARLSCELTVKEKNRSRSWLYSQGPLRQNIYDEIMKNRREGSHDAD